MERSIIISGEKLQFSLEDCKKVLESKQMINFRIIDYDFSMIDEKLGFLGEYVRINIVVDCENEARNIYCFVKFIPGKDSRIDIDLSLGAFKKEIFIYEEMFKKIKDAEIQCLQSVIPECFLTKPDYMLVFEDLTKSDYKPLSKRKYLDYSHVIVILRALVKLHASSLIFEEKHSRCLHEYFSQFDETFYSKRENHKGRMSFFAGTKGIQTEIELFPFESSVMTIEEFKIRAQNACEKVFELVKPSKKYRNVICHGDLWTTNFLMKYDGSKPNKCVLIDFQTARFVPPAHDVIALLYLTTSRDFRKQYLKEITDFYYSELTHELMLYGYDLGKIISRIEFEESCEEQRLFAIVQAATYFQFTHTNSKYMTELCKDSELWERTIYVDRTLLVVDNCKIDPEYKFILEESLKDLRDICEIVIK